jgi:hypothetical protein
LEELKSLKTYVHSHRLHAVRKLVGMIVIGVITLSEEEVAVVAKRVTDLYVGMTGPGSKVPLASLLEGVYSAFHSLFEDDGEEDDDQEDDPEF